MTVIQISRRFERPVTSPTIIVSGGSRGAARPNLERDSLLAAQLAIETRRHHEVITLTCRGELDAHSVGELASTIRGCCLADGVRAVRLDLSGIRFIDASSIGVLLATADRCRVLGVQFHAITGPRVATLMELCGRPADALNQDTGAALRRSA